jgi:DNA polymerase-3 subunit gamma/tau
MLGALDQSFLVSILDALANQEGAALLAVAEEMARRSLSYSAALQDLGTLLHKIAVFQSVPNAVTEETLYYDDIVRLAGVFSAEEVQLFYQIVVHGKNELALAPDEYAGFTMTLLRMLAFRPVSKLESSSVLNTKKNTGSANVSVGKAALENAKASVKLGKKETHVNVANAVAPVVEQEKIVLEKPVEKTEDIIRKENVTQNTSETVEELLHPIPELNWQGDWPLLVTHLPVRGMVQQLATQSQLCRVEMEGVNWVFHLRIPVETLLSAGTAVKLATALTEYFGKPIRISTEVGAVMHTAHQKEKDQQQQRLDTAKTSIEEDPVVKDIMAEFNATILPGSINPI